MALSALHSAATGLSSLNTALDVTANNLANVNTDAFKASRANFQDLMYQEKAQPGVRTAADDQRPTGLYVGLGVKVSGTQFDFAQGALQPTGRELDVAINGEGFFQVRVEDERSQDGIAYTRAGNFVTNSEGEIVLATDTGRVLQPPLQLEEGETQVAISADGTVCVISREGASNRRNGLVLLDCTDPHNVEIITEYVENLTVGFLEDVQIWENKIYRPDPNLCDSDGPIARFRRWAAQYYV